ncbi:murein biosynthesis integral membrane protein MurJ, partial [Actinotalea sp.]|uniref:murein biosynthesis integral membrane protein MurJ n=1 Tax=Actinotalea sp. TaxID=1872145 RepID=UPI00356810FE
MTAGESRLGKGTGVMAAGTAVSRVLGLVRTAVLVAAVGANVQAAGAFGIANTLPNMLYMLIAGGLVNAVLVPQVVRAYRTEQGQEYVDRLLTLSLTLLAGATVLLTAAAPLVVRVVATSVNPDYIHLATAFALWCIPQVFFYGLYTLLGQVLNARGSFGPLMWAPVLNNLISIVGFGVFIAVFGRYDPTGPLARPGDWGAGPIALLGGVATLGIIAQSLVLIIPLRRSGFRYRMRWDWRGAGLGTAGRVAGWTFGALLVGQVGVVAISRLASAADQQIVDGAHVAGKIAYDFSFLVFMLPHSLVTVSLLTSMFTRLSGHAAAGDTASMREDASRGLRLLGLFTVLAAAVLAVVALPLVRAINPAVSPAEAASFAPVIALFSLGLPALGAWSLTQRIYYANEDAKGLFWIQVAMAGVVAAGALLAALTLPASWWVAGAGASMALSYGLGAAWGGLTLRTRLGGTGRRILVMYAKAVLAAALAAAAGWPLVGLLGDPATLGMLPAMAVCVMVGVVMLTVDVIALRLMKVEELDAVAAPARTLLHRTMGRAGLRHPRPSPDRGGEQVDVVLGHGTLLAARYRLDHPVGTDLPGVERWLAQDQILDREVTATVLRSGRVREAQDGARRAALVTDPRLLRVLDVGDHEGLPYVVTERAPGHTLAELTARGPLPADQARAIVGEAAVALETARRRGVHHLALRPTTVHISPTGVVVSGLGIDGELREHGLGDARSTTRADTVALVALLYVALTGRRPGSPDGPWAAPVVGGTMVPPAELVPGVPNDLDTLCAVTLGPHDDGPHSPAELVRDLEPWGPVDHAELDASLPAHPVPASVPDAPVVAETPSDTSSTIDEAAA